LAISATCARGFAWSGHETAGPSACHEPFGT
jgi:hypothetical protein